MVIEAHHDLSLNESVQKCINLKMIWNDTTTGLNGSFCYFLYHIQMMVFNAGIVTVMKYCLSLYIVI